MWQRVNVAKVNTVVISAQCVMIEDTADGIGV
jgi:hypothetical protein